MASVLPVSQAPAADPVTMISALLDKENVVPDTPTTPVEAQPETEAEVGQPNAQVEGDDVEAVKNDTPTAEIPIDQLEAIELETTYKDEGGKDVTEKLPIKELRQGYMRQKDYQRKTAEIARQREEVGTSVRQGVESERTQYLENLKNLEAALIETAAPELKNVNWDDLATNNTYEYVRLRNRQDQISQALQSVKAKQQEVSTKIDADRRQAAQVAAQKTWATLEQDIPGWNPELYKATLKAAESVGYTEAEAGAWLDPKAIKLLHKVYQYDQLKAAKPPVEKKVVVVPKAIQPGSAVRPPPVRQAMDRLRKSGKIDDLTSVIANMK